ncbi:MAG: hypothetical protein Q4B26_17555 [Eubacteriales bacterium]|nr:hypothetical protein [Eubacteriales bacterium]
MMRQSNKTYVVTSKETQFVIEEESECKLDQRTVKRIVEILRRGNDAQVRQKKDAVAVYEVKVCNGQ